MISCMFWNVGPKRKYLRRLDHFHKSNLPLLTSSLDFKCNNVDTLFIYTKLCFSSCFSGKSRIYIFSNFHLRVLHEDHSLRFMAASDSVPAECLEHSGFHHCHDRVNIFCVFLAIWDNFGHFWCFLVLLTHILTAN